MTEGRENSYERGRGRREVLPRPQHRRVPVASAIKRWRVSQFLEREEKERATRRSGNWKEVENEVVRRGVCVIFSACCLLP